MTSRQLRTPPAGPGVRPALARERRWLVSDALVTSALRDHPVLPTTDATELRHARLIAFVLGMLALPDAGDRSIAAVTLDVAPGPLGRRLTMSQAEVMVALRALWIGGVIEGAADSTGGARFADTMLVSSPLGPAMRWPLVLSRLTEERRQGAQAGVMCFRVLLDRLPHPGGTAELSHTEAARELGLSTDQVKRGLRALVEAGLCVADRSSVSATRYALAPDLLVDVPGISVAAALTATPTQADTRVVARHLDEPTADDQASLASSATDPSAVSEAVQSLTLDIGGRRIHIPGNIRDVVLPATASAAVVEIDPATGQLIVRLR